MLQILLMSIFLHSGRLKHVNNIAWALILNKQCKLKVMEFLSLGSRGWGISLNCHFHLVWMSGAIPSITQKEFYIYDVLDITISNAGWENHVFKKKIRFLCVVLCQEPFFENLFFIFMYLICILSCITMHRERVTSKISLLVNLEKTSMTPLQTYTQAGLLTYQLALTSKQSFFSGEVDLSTDCSRSPRVMRCWWESVAVLMRWLLLVGTGRFWVDWMQRFSLNIEPHHISLQHFVWHSDDVVCSRVKCCGSDWFRIC